MQSQYCQKGRLSCLSPSFHIGYLAVVKGENRSQFLSKALAAVVIGSKRYSLSIQTKYAISVASIYVSDQ
jgi:hypothetical protein